MFYWWYIVFVPCASLLPHPSTLLAQDFVLQALGNLPAQTSGVEYFCPAKLRSLPGYTRFRKRYVDPRLQLLEKSFSNLGVGEQDVDEMLIAWPSPDSGNKELEGIIRGRFDIRRVARSAQDAKIATTKIGSVKAFCSSDESSCFAVLNEMMAAFGPADFLLAMASTPKRHKASLFADSRFKKLFEEIQAKPPLWGIALDESVPDMFPMWLAARGRRRMDWSAILKPAKAMIFYAELNEDIQFHLNLDYPNSKEANRIHKTLETLRRQQRAMWMNVEPGRPDPLDGIQMGVTGRRVSLTTKADL
jgi:hypothetical protein